MRLRYGGPGGPPRLVTIVTFFLCFFSISSLIGLAAADKSKSYSMQTLCKNHFLQQLYRKIDGAVLWSQNERNLDCVITFQTHSILQRFMLRFDGLQLDCNDHLFIYDGAHAVGTYKFDLSCKNTKQNLGAMFTRTNYVTLKYVTDNWGTESNGFKLVITAVKDPKHACTEFRCNLREFCISTDLVCDKINHCADGSDESSNNLCQNNDSGTILGLEVTWFVVVLISSLLVLLVLIVAISICVCRRGSWNNSHGNSVQQQNASYSSHMYGSNGHMAIKPGVGSTTTLTDGGLLHATPTSGNSRRPAGPPGFRMPPARGRPYCPAG
ncbi:uncharacterized protein LOC125503906 isoform X2 [Dendroctonus ponderosae]|uniref:uncharacterized protein LOC109533303 isoform X2 n=1 Tax=Dendroctonus ponderosae TaxID=77166 RepID=UPI00203546A9|nr:uncharacterized protein LOC109533303 isoform X2 [Dendroctonus ponderosae]XP_048520999.1 uncharacterized protein LOC125503906 isoform X2 [Dendroctonus ponderosae]